jgi:hypothetical protein
MINVQCITEAPLREELLLPKASFCGPVTLNRRRLLVSGGAAAIALSAPTLFPSPSQAQEPWGNPFYALARGLQLVARVIDHMGKILSDIGATADEVEKALDLRLRVSPPQALLVAANPTHKTLEYTANYLLSDELVMTGELETKLHNNEVPDNELLKFAKSNMKATKELTYQIPPKHYSIYRIDGAPLKLGHYVTALTAPKNHNTDVSMLRVLA